MRRLPHLLFGLLLGIGIGQANDPSYSVLINEQPSRVQVLREGDSLALPLSFPIEAQDQSFEVSIHRDQQAGRIETKIKQIRRKTRGEQNCYWCEATGKCVQDYPAGSGLNYSGASEYFCNGTGLCHHCSGTGKI